MSDRVFVGFGFGAIQAGLFLYEAHRTGGFGRLVVAEVVPELVDAVRRNGGACSVNVAERDGVRAHVIRGLEIYNPAVAADREQLVAALADAAEIATALPSVKFYGTGREGDVVDLLSRGLLRKEREASRPRAIVYTAENHNHAAELLAEALRTRGVQTDPARGRVHVLNTVIGKMSGVVTDPAQAAEQRLAPVVPGSPRAFLVEAFNRILITRIAWRDFERGIAVFEEKPDLLPFEEAKLYGHNATHALLGYLLRERGRRTMSEASDEPALLALARAAFVEESGRALCRKYAGLDALFTEAGYAAYVDDLLERMLNPHLRDAVERVTRDPRRKLGWQDRLVGTMRLALAHGIAPRGYAMGAAAALRALQAEAPGKDAAARLDEVWTEAAPPPAERQKVRDLILNAALPA